MTDPSSRNPFSASRRGFLMTSTAATFGLGMLSNAHAAGSDTIKVGLVGCGGRGSGAAEDVCKAAGTTYNIKLHAMADAFADRLRNCRDRLQGERRHQGQGRRLRRSLLRRPRRLSEGDRLLRPGDAGDPAGLPPPAHRGDDQGRQAPLRREAGRRRRHRHPQGAGRPRRSHQEGALGRHRHPAPAPGGLRRMHEANPRRRDRRHHRRPGLLESRPDLGRQAPEPAGPTPSTRSATGITSSGSAATTSSSSTCITSTWPAGPSVRTRFGPSAWAAGR